MDWEAWAMEILHLWAEAVSQRQYRGPVRVGLLVSAIVGALQQAYQMGWEQGRKRR